jgi:hypothetical protein
MANPRNTTDFGDLLAEQVTYLHDSSIVFDRTKANGSAQVGLAVRLTADRTVGLTQDATPVHGKLINVEGDGKCAVQVRGYCELPGGTGATFTLGAGVVGDLDTAAEGYVRGRAAATLAEVAVQRGRVIDDTTLTAVIIDLG